MERKQDSPRGPGGRRIGRSALLMAGVLAAGVLATAGPTSAAKADGCYGSCGCDNGCGYSSYSSYCGGGCGYVGHELYTGHEVCGGGCGYQGFQGFQGFQPLNEGCLSDTTLSVEPSQVQEGESVTLTAEVTWTRDEGTPEPAGDGGTVTFMANGNQVGVSTVENGQASTSVTLPAGTYEATAVYDGMELCGSSTSVAVPFEVTAVTPPPPPAPPSVKVKVKVVVAPRVRIAIFKGHFHHMAPAAPARPAVPVTG